jgi:hypothetical protein
VGRRSSLDLAQDERRAEISFAGEINCRKI